MFKKTFIFLFVFVLVFSCMIVPSFADDSRLPPTEISDFGYYPVEYVGGDVDYTVPCFLFPRSSNYLTYQTKRVYNIGSDLYYTFEYHDGNSIVSVNRKYNPDSHFLVVPYSSQSMPFFAPESGTNFFELYPRDIKKFSIYKTNSLLADHYSYPMLYPGTVLTPTPDPDVWHVVSLFNSVNFSSYEFRYLPPDSETVIVDLVVDSPVYISFDESFSLPKYNDSSPIVGASLEWCVFYSYLSPVVAPVDIPDPGPIVPDDPDSPSYVTVVTDVLFGVFGAMGGLIIYPGITLLTVVFCYVGVYLARFILKLIAGG